MERVITFLGRERFDPEARMIYKLPYSQLPKININIADELISIIDFSDPAMTGIIKELICHHKERQVPRLRELKRYDEAEGDIKFRPGKGDEFRSDNRISSSFANFITTFNRGVIFGNPVRYTGGGKALEWVNEFAKSVNEKKHHQNMMDDCGTYGRAYEQVYRKQDAQEQVAKLNPLETFVVYDTTIDLPSIFSVRYYDTKMDGKITTTIEINDNSGRKTVYTCKDGKLTEMAIDNEQSGESYFNSVTVTEWFNNEKRMGDAERVLDDIDAYDLSQSELANFQQDLSDAYLVIEGNPLTGQGKWEEQKKVWEDMRKARLLVLDHPPVGIDGKSGPNPKAYYLTKNYDSVGSEAYKKRLVADILRFTFLIDFTDENMGGNSTGVGLKWKGWATDNNVRSKSEMVSSAIMRRYRLLAYSWSLSKNEDYQTIYDQINNMEIKFTFNAPKSTLEIAQIIQALTGVISGQSAHEMAFEITGVDADVEAERIRKEQEFAADTLIDQRLRLSKESEEVIIDDVSGVLAEEGSGSAD